MAKKKPPPSLPELFLKEYGEWLAVIDGMKADLDLDLTDEMEAVPGYSDLIHMRDVAELARTSPESCDPEHLRSMISTLEELKKKALKVEQRFINSRSALEKIDCMMGAIPHAVLERANKAIWNATDAWERKKEYESRRRAYKQLVRILRSLGKSLTATQTQEA